jgi:hypothetical protein
MLVLNTKRNGKTKSVITKHTCRGDLFLQKAPVFLWYPDREAGKKGEEGKAEEGESCGDGEER